MLVPLLHSQPCEQLRQRCVPRISTSNEDYILKCAQLQAGCRRAFPAQRCPEEQALTLAFLATQSLNNSFPQTFLRCFITPIYLAAIDEDPAGYLMMVKNGPVVRAVFGECHRISELGSHS